MKYSVYTANDAKCKHSQIQTLLALKFLHLILILAWIGATEQQLTD